MRTGSIRHFDQASCLCTDHGDLLFYPTFLIRDITAKYARKRAARNQWHPLAKERCRPDGPTTRLYDLELAQGLHKEEGTSDPTDAW